MAWMARRRPDSNNFPDDWKVSDGDPPPGQLGTLGPDSDRYAEDLLDVPSGFDGHRIERAAA